MFIDFSLVFLLTEAAHFHYMLSIVFAYLIASIVNFTLQKKTTFKCRKDKIYRQYLIFFAVGSVGALINLLIVFCYVEYFHLWYMHGKIIATFIAFFWNFWGNKLLTFRA